MGKAELRRHLLRERALRPGTGRAAAGDALAAAVLPLVPPGADVAAYASVGSEPPTRALLVALAGRGSRVLLPVLLPDGDLDWATGPLVPGPRGLLEPGGARLGREALAACAVVVVPALAVDRTGRRLGRGGGSYDRALPGARGLTVALLYDGELRDVLPGEEHDVPVGAVALPSSGVLRLPAGRSSSSGRAPTRRA